MKKFNRFEQLVATARTRNPAVINYMFLAMRYGRPASFSVGKMNEFAGRLKKFESIIDTAYRANKAVFNSDDIKHSR